MRRNKGGVQRRPMDVGGKKSLHGAVAIRAPAGDIAHGNVVGRTKRAGNDIAQLPEHGDGVDLTKGVKQCKYIHGFSLFLGVRYQKYTGKAIFMPLSIGVGIVFAEVTLNHPCVLVQQ